MAQSSKLVFKVHRQRPELIAPARPTTHECKPLSDIDDQESFRFQLPGISFYRHNPSLMKGRDPVQVIRDAVAKALVFFYPLAGRLREGPGRKLFVDCTGEGIVFIGADADVSLSDFGEVLHPPFPCSDELIYDSADYNGILDCPLVIIQVTRLKCGGFIYATRVNHTMLDGLGLALFLRAVGEIARGATAPSIKPVWQRHILNARDEPRVTCKHDEYVDIEKVIIPQYDNVIERPFFFGRKEISALRRFVPPHLNKCSTFDVLAASIWRCRTISLQFDPEEEVRFLGAVNSRTKFSPPLAPGFYGNSFAYPAAVTTAGKLCQNPLSYALELVMKAKSEATEEYMKSLADLMVTSGRRLVCNGERSFFLSDVSRAGYMEVDYGWGKPTYGGPINAGHVPVLINFLISIKNEKGETGVVLPFCLPAPAMEIFGRELDRMLNGIAPAFDTKSAFVVSAL